MVKDDKRKMEQELQRLLAIEFVKKYCEENNISLEKLSHQRFELSYEECGFFQPSQIKADGLTNDLKTSPKLTLGIRNENGILVIEETEYTIQYLKE